MIKQFESSSPQRSSGRICLVRFESSGSYGLDRTDAPYDNSMKITSEYLCEQRQRTHCARVGCSLLFFEGTRSQWGSGGSIFVNPALMSSMCHWNRSDSQWHSASAPYLRGCLKVLKSSGLQEVEVITQISDHIFSAFPDYQVRQLRWIRPNYLNDLWPQQHVFSKWQS